MKFFKNLFRRKREPDPIVYTPPVQDEAKTMLVVPVERNGPAVVPVSDPKPTEKPAEKIAKSRSDELAEKRAKRLQEQERVRAFEREANPVKRQMREEQRLRRTQIRNLHRHPSARTPKYTPEEQAARFAASQLDRELMRKKRR